MKRFIAIILVTTMMFLVGCEFWDQLIVESYKSQEYAEQFCLALSFDDVEKAKEYLHPDWSINNPDLEEFISNFEKENGIKFSNGVAVKCRFDAEMAIYGSQDKKYQLGVKVVIGNKELKLYFIVLDNEEGYGISDFMLYSNRPD